MTTGQIIGIVVAVLILLAVIAAVVIILRRRQQSKQLQQRFGPEYDRAVGESDDRKRAEQELRERAQRREQLDIRPLPAASRQRYLDQWGRVQTQFVDDPILAVGEAESLLNSVMRERGYPVDRFEEQAGLIAVDHPEIVHHYRGAHDVNVRSTRGEATTEEMREAFVHYRALFERLLGEDEGAATGSHLDAERDVRDRPQMSGRDDFDPNSESSGTLGQHADEQHSVVDVRGDNQASGSAPRHGATRRDAPPS